MNPTRRLAAILAADVAGYSRLMGADEEGRLERLKALRRELLDPKIAEHRGRIVKTTGDGMLVEFASVVDAVRCAVAVQQAMPERNSGVAADNRIELRIGINLGDVIVEGDDLYGDGVNIAARIEALADAGGVFVSNTVHDHVRDRLPFAFEDLGEQQVKNIARPVRVYRVRDAAAKLPVAPALPLPDKPSIAVLPFANMSGDPEQEYFADGMVEEIITALSRIRWLFVIARNSSFAYKGQTVDVKQVGRELGVRYVLEGSVRKGGNRVRITAQLIDATNGAHLWADRFDGSLEDVFELQDKVAISVAGVIEPTLRQTEIERARRKRPDSLDAYDLYLRALPYVVAAMPEEADKALPLLGKAIELEPDFAAAHAMIAWCHEARYCAAGCRRRRATPLCIMRAKPSPRAVTMRPRWPPPALSWPFAGAIMKPRSPHAIGRLRSPVRRHSRSVSARPCAPGRATMRSRSSMLNERSASAPSIPGYTCRIWAWPTRILLPDASRKLSLLRIWRASRTQGSPLPLSCLLPRWAVSAGAKTPRLWCSGLLSCSPASQSQPRFSPPVT
jgi:adenylate cyclase